jgi:hypothetical protein
MAAKDERRGFQRLKLAKPLLGMMDGQSALILDIGVTGAYIEHYGELNRGNKFHLSFRWQGSDLAFLCEVSRSTVIRPAEAQPAVSHSGVTFVESVGNSAARLQEMLGTFIGQLLAAQKANAAPDATAAGNPVMLDQIGQARRSRTRGFIAYLFDGTSWMTRRTTIGDQPRNGFTVAAYEEEEDLEALCRAYEAADEEGRRLIRLVAELSVSSAKK